MTNYYHNIPRFKRARVHNMMRGINILVNYYYHQCTYKKKYIQERFRATAIIIIGDHNYGDAPANEIGPAHRVRFNPREG